MYANKIIQHQVIPKLYFNHKVFIKILSSMGADKMHFFITACKYFIHLLDNVTLLTKMLYITGLLYVLLLFNSFSLNIHVRQINDN